MICEIEGCDKQVVTRTYCGAHYQRLRKEGKLKLHTQLIAEKGKMTEHKFYGRWSKLCSQNSLCTEWKQSFWKFIEDIGDDNGCTKLWRPNQREVFGPNNFIWAEKLTGELKNRYYQRLYRTTKSYRNGRYVKQYGITIEEYEKLWNDQNGKCAICNEKESKVIKNNVDETLRMLAVDHDHKTNKVRALLCADCNRALGMFKDNKKLLFKAAEYLEKYE